jgi:hypothetical protein
MLSYIIFISTPTASENRSGVTSHPGNSEGHYALLEAACQRMVVVRRVRCNSCVYRILHIFSVGLSLNRPFPKKSWAYGVLQTSGSFIGSLPLPLRNRQTRDVIQMRLDLQDH